MGAKPNPNRRGDITKALRKAKPGDMLSLEQLAFVWGTTKGPFCTAKKFMTGMPEPVPQGTQHIFAARAALQSMLDYETRNDAAAASRAHKRDQILGVVHRDRQAAVIDDGTSVRDLQIMNRMATEIEEREREQGKYIPAAEVAAIAGEVFSALSEFMAGLSNALDPNGLLDPRLRGLIDGNAETALLGFHKKLKGLLDADAVDGSSRRANDRSGNARTRRKRT